MIEKLLSFQEQRARISFCRRLLIFSMGLILLHELIRLVTSQFPAMIVLVLLITGVGALLLLLKRERQDLRAASFEMDRRGDHPDLFPTLLELDGSRESAMTVELRKLARKEYLNRVSDKDVCSFKGHVWKVLVSCLLLVLVILFPFFPLSSDGHGPGNETSLPLDSPKKESMTGGKSTQESGGDGSSKEGNKSNSGKKDKNGKDSDFSQPGSKESGESSSASLKQGKGDVNQQTSGESINKGAAPGSQPKKSSNLNPGSNQNKVPNPSPGSNQSKLEQQKVKSTAQSLASGEKDSKVPIPRTLPPTNKDQTREREKSKVQTKDLSNLKKGVSLKPNSKNAKFDPKKASGGKAGEGKEFDWKRVQPGTVRNQKYREGRDRVEGFLSDPRIPVAYKENVLRMMESIQGKRPND